MVGTGRAGYMGFGRRLTDGCEIRPLVFLKRDV